MGAIYSAMGILSKMIFVTSINSGQIQHRKLFISMQFHISCRNSAIKCLNALVNEHYCLMN